MLGPDVRVGRRVDQLRGDPHARSEPLHASLENVADAERGANLAQVAAIAVLVLPDRLATDDLELGDAGKFGEEFVLHPAGKEGVVRLGAEVLERQHGNTLFRSRRCRRRGRRGGRCRAGIAGLSRGLGGIPDQARGDERHAEPDGEPSAAIVETTCVREGHTGASGRTRGRISD